MVNKRIVFLSLVLLCSSVARASDAVPPVVPADLTGISPVGVPNNSNATLTALTGVDAALTVLSAITPDASQTIVEKELVTAASSTSVVADLEESMNHLTGSLGSRFLSADAQEKIKEELTSLEKLVSAEITTLAAKVTDVLKSEATFNSQDVKAVIAECRDPKNRAAIVDAVLTNVFALIADLHAQEGQAVTTADRAALSAKRNGLEKIEAALLAAKPEIAMPVETGDVKLLKYFTVSGKNCATIRDGGLVAAGALVGGALVWVLKRAVPVAE